jgi:hypothetical protein
VPALAQMLPQHVEPRHQVARLGDQLRGGFQGNRRGSSGA